MIKNIIIIADLHLKFNTYQLFNKFCLEKASKADELYILGDLFDTWLGDDVSVDYYSETIKTLKNLTQTTKIFIIHGNHDFLLSDKFTKSSNTHLIHSPYLLKTNYQNFILTHGDEFCTDDKKYQKFKKIIQHSITKFIILNLTKKLRLKLLKKIQQKSTKAKIKKNGVKMNVNQMQVDNFMKKYPNTNLIHGHTHKQNTHKKEQYTRYVLGDWNKDNGNYIKIDKKLSFFEFN